MLWSYRRRQQFYPILQRVPAWPGGAEHSRDLKALLLHYAKAHGKKEEVTEAICILHLELNEAAFWRAGRLL